jgi:hypothetical protein
MLVYANHLSLQGSDAEDAVFKAIGGWLKEQLSFGLHPDQLRKDGEFNGTRGDVRSWLRVLATAEEEPKLYSWVLKFSDEKVRGRQWIVEVGVKTQGEHLDLSCVVKTDEHSTLVASAVTASQPRLVRYVVSNIQHIGGAGFAASVPGIEVKTVGEDTDSYHSLLAEIERPGREGPIVIVSPTKDGEYLLQPEDLQQKLIGLAQVVKVSLDFNSYDMSEVLGKSQSAWGGAINILYMPTGTGHVPGRYFLSDAITAWGDTEYARVSQVLALVTNNTNIARLRKHIRPEGVLQLSLRRHMQAARAKSEEMSAAQLRTALEEAAKQASEQAKYFDELVEENSQLETSASAFKDDLEEARDELAKREFTIQSLKDQLNRANGERPAGIDAEEFVDLVSREDPPSPRDCLVVIEKIYGDRCTVLPSARNSAEKMHAFIYGRQLLELLKRLATDYRAALMEGGDSKARAVFGKSEYAAKESETVMANKAMRRERTFEYEGKKVEMFRHLKIGADDDATKTIRVHFHGDAEREKIVIGYCGEHLSVSSH